jgi:hypothetical protein
LTPLLAIGGVQVFNGDRPSYRFAQSDSRTAAVLGDKLDASGFEGGEDRVDGLCRNVDIATANACTAAETIAATIAHPQMALFPEGAPAN